MWCSTQQGAHHTPPTPPRPTPCPALPGCPAPPCCLVQALCLTCSSAPITPRPHRPGCPVLPWPPCCPCAGIVFDLKQSKYKKLGKLLDKFVKDKVRGGVLCCGQLGFSWAGEAGTAGVPLACAYPVPPARSSSLRRLRPSSFLFTWFYVTPSTLTLVSLAFSMLSACPARSSLRRWCASRSASPPSTAARRHTLALQVRRGGWRGARLGRLAVLLFNSREWAVELPGSHILCVHVCSMVWEEGEAAAGLPMSRLIQYLTSGLQP